MSFRPPNFNSFITYEPTVEISKKELNILSAAIIDGPGPMSRQATTIMQEKYQELYNRKKKN